MEADLREWAGRLEGKTMEQKKAKKVEVELDVERYETKLQNMSALDVDYDKTLAKLQKLRMQQEYLSDMDIAIEATRARPGASVDDDSAPKDGDLLGLTEPGRQDRKSTKGKNKGSKSSSVCSIS